MSHGQTCCAPRISQAMSHGCTFVIPFGRYCLHATGQDRPLSRASCPLWKLCGDTGSPNLLECAVWGKGCFPALCCKGVGERGVSQPFVVGGWGKGCSPSFPVHFPQPFRASRCGEKMCSHPFVAPSVGKGVVPSPLLQGSWGKGCFPALCAICLHGWDVRLPRIHS